MTLKDTFEERINKNDFSALLELAELVAESFNTYDKEELKGEAILKMTRKLDKIKAADKPFNYAIRLANNTMRTTLARYTKDPFREFDVNTPSEEVPYKEIPEELMEEVTKFLLTERNKLRVFYYGKKNS